MNLGPAGPLDFAENENPLRTGAHHGMNKLSNKINVNTQNINRKEMEQEMLM